MAKTLPVTSLRCFRLSLIYIDSLVKCDLNGRILFEPVCLSVPSRVVVFDLACNR